MATKDPELARLLLEELKRHLASLEDPEGPKDRVGLARRVAHAMKGSAGLAGEPELSSAMQAFGHRLKQGDASAVAETRAALHVAVERLAAGQSATPSQWPLPPANLAPGAIANTILDTYRAEAADRLSAIDDALADGADPFDALADIYRHVHNLKGAASAVGDEPLAWFCHGLEEHIRGGDQDRAAALRALNLVATFRVVLGGLLDEPSAALASLRGSPQIMSRGPRGREPEEPKDPDLGIRVPSVAVDRLLDHVSALTVARERIGAHLLRTAKQAKTLRAARAEFGEALRLIGPPRPWGAPAAALRRIEHAAEAVAQLGEELDRASESLKGSDATFRESTQDAQRILSGMRQTPIRHLFDRLAAAARAEGRRSGRELEVVQYGADQTIDRGLSERLSEPCLQLVRNAIAHGIEPPDLRHALGKPKAATLRLEARRSTGKLRLSIRDDGAGVDAQVVRTRAVASGLVSEALANAAEDDMLLELLFAPGFSMREESPDLLSGRGVGLDITLASIRRLGGTIRVSSLLGQGFEARVEVPLEQGLARVLWVEAQGHELALTASHVSRVSLMSERPEKAPHLATCFDAGLDAIAPYEVELRHSPEAEPVRFGVDAVGDVQEVLVRPLSPLLLGFGPFAGAIVGSDSALRLLVDPYALAPLLRSRGLGPESRAHPPSRP